MSIRTVAAARRVFEPPAERRLTVLGCPIDPLDMKQTVSRCEETIEKGEYVQHMAVNTAKLVQLRDDPRLRKIVSQCGLINADGQGVVWAAWLLGRSRLTRVAGIDLMRELLILAEERGFRVYILGAKREVLDEAVSRLREDHPALLLAGYRDGYFADAEAELVCAEIRDSLPDIVFVAMNTPRKEYFLGEHGPSLGASFVMGVGGAIDVVAGITRRAPERWQTAGLEWLYRLLQEPHRLWRRYAISNARFALILGRALVARSLGIASRGGDTPSDPA